MGHSLVDQACILDAIQEAHEWASSLLKVVVGNSDILSGDFRSCHCHEYHILRKHASMVHSRCASATDVCRLLAYNNIGLCETHHDIEMQIMSLYYAYAVDVVTDLMSKICPLSTTIALMLI